jgi:TolB-like protein/Tfp pilus assembly protein PilF
MSWIQQFLIELRRRRVFRVAGIYIVGCWVVLQVADLAFQSMGLPDASLRWVWLAAFLASPIALIFGWRYDITPEGIVRTPPIGADAAGDLSLRRADHYILAALGIVAVAVLLNLFSEIGKTQKASDEIRAAPSNSIAVLPLSNLSNEQQQEYFVAGMHEALIADLARISGLKVISRLSTELYRGSEKQAAKIGSELGVAYLIEGSVLKQEDMVRISVQLIDAQDDATVWAESYERKLANVLELQSNVARAIARQVKVNLTPYEDQQLSGARTVDPEAYQLYLKGRFHWYRFSEADLKLALEYFQQAINIDPNYALAYVGFADALATPAHAGMMPTTQVFPAATQFVERALELEPDLAEAHDMLARIRFAYDWDWEAAERGFRKAISLKPGYPDVHVVYSQFLAIMNRPDEALEEARIGATLDPLNPWFQLEYAQRKSWYGDYESAYEEIIRLITRHPDIASLRQYLWDLASVEGDYGVASASAIRYFELEGEPGVAAQLGNAESEVEYRDQMRRAAVELEDNALRPYISRVNLARVRMHAGDHEKALDLLEEALNVHDSQLGYTTTNPLFKPVWDSDRYRSIRRAINL